MIIISTVVEIAVDAKNKAEDNMIDSRIKNVLSFFSLIFLSVNFTIIDTYSPSVHLVVPLFIRIILENYFLFLLLIFLYEYLILNT